MTTTECYHLQRNKMLSVRFVRNLADSHIMVGKLLKCMKRINALPVGRERTEEEKLRRHIYGDKGASFSKGKRMCLLTSGVSGCITTLATKDNLICEIYDD